MEQGIKVTVEEDIRWKFCHIKSLNLLPNIMIKNKINEQGYQEAILVRDGIVTEGCHSNFFMVKNNKLIYIRLTISFYTALHVTTLLH